MESEIILMLQGFGMRINDTVPRGCLLIYGGSDEDGVPVTSCCWQTTSTLGGLKPPPFNYICDFVDHEFEQGSAR